MRRHPTRDERLPPLTKFVFSWGDHVLNVTLASLSLLYLYHLTEHIGLRPGLAGLVLLIGRFVDAFTDPVMGRISDQTTWKQGRRRPYFLLGALPLGLSFAALWFNYPLESQLAKFTVYAALYVLYSLSYTLVAVPYAALLPELTLDYQERTSISTYRSVAASLGTLVAAAVVRPLAAAFGGGAAGFAWAGAIVGSWVTWPWFAVHRVTWERPDFQRRPGLSFLAGLRALAANDSFRRLVGLYICSRVAMDIVGAMFLFFFVHWLRRPDDFAPTMAVLILSAIGFLPVWLRLARTRDKAPLFVAGTCWWIAVQGVILLVTPGWPSWTIIGLAVLAGVGYGVAEMMPWSMLGDVIDEDELETGERREGLYAGFFTFLRKLGGATGVFLAGQTLEVAGLQGGAEPSSTALLAIRGLTSVAPALCLALAALIALRYPISQRKHQETLLRIAARAHRPPASA